MASIDTQNLSTSGPYTTAIFDLGDVLFTWSPSTPKSPLPAKALRNILRSSHWFEYEKGNIAEAEAYSRVAQEFQVDPAAVKNAFQAARDSLQSNSKMIEVIRELRGSGISVYAMSNISAPDWEVLKTKMSPADWALFDRVFTSASARERKPNIGFFEYVVKQTGVDPSRIIFVDDKLENIVTARSFGMHGINFAQLLILEATGDESLVDYVKHCGQFNFFQKQSVLTTERFPNDLDTTSIGLTVSAYIDTVTKHKIMDEMLKCQNSDGIIQVYFDHSRPRIDPVVCVNVLNLFYKNGRGHEIPGTLDWVEQVLTNRAYISGTYYYASADQFLFFLSRLLQSSTYVRQRLGPVFRERVTERFGLEADSLSLAARIIAATAVGLVDDRDVQALLSMQCEDGSWGDGWFYRYGSSGILIKNDGASTAFAIRGIREVRALHLGRMQ
ncbi:hypothetical protein H0H87_008824 [Tephrocybe sp. NHM501043]|nr:hypothetical protein H0H87_008824 [Tephrocybe sp. NHM501043]